MIRELLAGLRVREQCVQQVVLRVELEALVSAWDLPVHIAEQRLQVAIEVVLVAAALEARTRAIRGAQLLVMVEVGTETQIHFGVREQVVWAETRQIVLAEFLVIALGFA